MFLIRRNLGKHEKGAGRSERGFKIAHMNRCNNCGQGLIEIDNRGERLIGCLTCNLWSPPDGKRWTRLYDEDLARFITCGMAEGQKKERRTSWRPRISWP
jgi:hypothetical protein